jgi:hypothetical protein
MTKTFIWEGVVPFDKHAIPLQILSASLRAVVRLEVKNASAKLISNSAFQYEGKTSGI